MSSHPWLNSTLATRAPPRAVGDFFRSWPTPFQDRAAALGFLGEGSLERAWIDDLESRSDAYHPRFDPDVMALVITATPRWDERQKVSVPTLVAYAENGMFSEQQKGALVEAGQQVTDWGSAKETLKGASDRLPQERTRTSCAS